MAIAFSREPAGTLWPMFDTIAGLPVHVLVIHAVVVLTPIAAILALVYVARPQWRRALRWPTLGLALVSAASAFVAAESGENLERRLESIGEHSQALETHTEAGDVARTVIALFALVVLIAVLWALRPGAPAPAPVAIIVTILLVAASLAALWFVFRAGHTGAEVAWADVISKTHLAPEAD